MKIRGIEEVTKWRLCLGCGACAYLSGGAIEMLDDSRQGHRPVLRGDLDEEVMADCLKGCPVAGGVPAVDRSAQGVVEGIGPVLEVWEGHAADPMVRHLGSSGGILTALGCFAIESGGMHGVLHVAGDSSQPLANRTVMSRTREDLIKGTGSRYAPASVCDGLDQIERAPGPCVFIGQPSEVAALRQCERLRPQLARNVGIVMSFFCAGSPASLGTDKLLRSKGIDPSQVAQIRYRGRGWPGKFAVWLRGNSRPVLELSYAESWGFVQSFRPWSVHLWPDGLGEQADLSCGDPWDRPGQPDDPGSSLVVVRSEAGRAFLRAAVAAGAVELVPADVGRVAASQQNLVRKKGAVWGRLFAMRLLGLPVPVFPGARLFPFWLRLPLADKLRATLGTVRRVIERRYYLRDACAMPLRHPADDRLGAGVPGSMKVLNSLSGHGH